MGFCCCASHSPRKIGMKDIPELSVPTSREYKVMLDSKMFERKASLASFQGELLESLHPFLGTKRPKKVFALDAQHEVSFLDTKDFEINSHRLLLRERVILGKKRQVELTLKCRSPDYCFALGADLRTEKGLKSNPKLEEDICPPFVSRFSKSSTVKLDAPPPTNIKQASKVFAVLSQLDRGGPESDLVAVNGLRMFEEVFIGPTVEIDNIKAGFALILWSRGRRGRKAAVELSFKIKLVNGSVSQSTALAFMEVFESIQRMDWCLPSAMTKTAYIYRA